MYVLTFVQPDIYYMVMHTMFKKQSHKIRSVLPFVFFQKAILKTDGNFLENDRWQRAYWKQFKWERNKSILFLLYLFCQIKIITS